MEWLTTATSEVVSLVGTVLTAITSNATLALIFAGTCIIPIAFRTLGRFRKAK